MKKFYFLLKLLLLGLIFFWIIRSVNIYDTYKVLLKTNYYFFILAFILNNLSHIFITIKWQKLANPLNIKSGFLELLKLNYIAIFYSSFIPGQSSGEIIKGMKLAKTEGSVQKVWVPIFIDKITNILMVFIIGLIAVLSDEQFRQNTLLLITVSFSTVLLSLITVILFSENTEKLVQFLKSYLITLLKVFKLNTDPIKNFSLSYLKDYKKNEFLIIEAMFWSFLVKFPHIIAFYLLALSLNINLTIFQSAWLFSIVSIVTLLPISFSGLGVREGTMIALLSQVGIERSSSLSLSILIFTMGVLIALMGGIIELFSGLQIVKKRRA